MMMMIIVNLHDQCLIKICILWPDNADIFYENATIIHNFPLSLPQYGNNICQKKWHSIRIY